MTSSVGGAGETVVHSFAATCEIPSLFTRYLGDSAEEMLEESLDVDEDMIEDHPETSQIESVDFNEETIDNTLEMEEVNEEMIEDLPDSEMREQSEVMEEMREDRAKSNGKEDVEEMVDVTHDAVDACVQEEMVEATPDCESLEKNVISFLPLVTESIDLSIENSVNIDQIHDKINNIVSDELNNQSIMLKDTSEETLASGQIYLEGEFEPRHVEEDLSSENPGGEPEKDLGSENETLDSKKDISFDISNILEVKSRSQSRSSTRSLSRSRSRSRSISPAILSSKSRSLSRTSYKSRSSSLESKQGESEISQSVFSSSTPISVSDKGTVLKPQTRFRSISKEKPKSRFDSRSTSRSRSRSKSRSTTRSRSRSVSTSSSRSRSNSPMITKPRLSRSKTKSESRSLSKSESRSLSKRRSRSRSNSSANSIQNIKQSKTKKRTLGTDEESNTEESSDGAKRQEQVSEPTEKKIQEDSDDDIRNNEVEEEEKTGNDFEMMLQRKRAEHRTRRTKKKDIDVINDNDDAIAKMIADMRIAAKEDRDLNSMGKPATKKMGMFKNVMHNLHKIELQMAFVEANLLSVMTDWLAPMPDKSLPHLVIRTEFLKLLQSLKIDDTTRLRESGIGKAVMYLYRHPKEERKNKYLAGQIINEWARPIFHKKTDFSQMTKEMRRSQDADMAARLGRKKKRKAETEEEPIKPGAPGWVARARVPMVDNAEYINRPEWQTTVEVSEAAKKNSLTLLEKHKRAFAERKRMNKNISLVKISLEGNRMQM